MASVARCDCVRVAVVGAGAMANRVHYPSLASFRDVRIVGICDVDAVRLNATADKYQVEGRYTDYRAMIEQVVPDAVYAIGQPHIMYDIWIWCLQQGLNLYIEKPMGITYHQARTLADLAAKHGCITQVSFQRRNSPMAVALREECLKRGAVVHAVCRFYKCLVQPFTDARDHMLDDGVHAIDTLRWICNGEVTSIHPVTKRVIVPDINFISAILEFDNGATGLLLNSWTSGRRVFAIEIHAPGVCAEADLEGKGYLYADGDTQGIVYDARQVAESDEFFIYGGFRAKHREFVDCLKEGRQPSSSFADALKTMEVAERILAKSLLQGI